MISHLHAVAIAGGSGTRLWPLSRRARPKQLLPLAGPEGRSLLAATFERLASQVPAERRWMVVGAEHAAACRAAVPEVAAERVIVEPRARNTAAAVALAAQRVAALDPDAILAVLPADHHVADHDAFAAAITQAAAIAARDRGEPGRGPIVTLGITPTAPETGYGYIERGNADPRGGYRVATFREKPDRKTAEDFLAAGTFLWNAGVFVMRADVFQAELARQMPEHHRRFAALAAGEADIDSVYAELEPVSIDYGVMEGAPDVVVVPVECGWSDVGTLAALRASLPSSPDGNHTRGRVLTIDSRNCVVHAGGDHLVALLGCEDLVVIHTEDATVVLPAARAQDVRDVVAALDDRDLGEHR